MILKRRFDEKEKTADSDFEENTPISFFEKNDYGNRDASTLLESNEG